MNPMAEWWVPEYNPTPISPEYNPTPPILNPSYPPSVQQELKHQEVWDSSNSSSVGSKERLEASYARGARWVAENATDDARATVEEAARRIEAWLQQTEEEKRSEEEQERWWRWCTNGSAAWVCACTIQAPAYQALPTGLWRKATIVDVIDRHQTYMPPAAHLPGRWAVEVQLDTPDAFGPARWWLPHTCEFLQPRDSESPPSWTE